MAAAVPEITKVECIANPADPSTRAWKRFLFYILGYCDTFHDFSAHRSVKTEGKSIDPKMIPERREFVLGLIDSLDDIRWGRNWVGRFDQLRKQYKFGTFENSVFGAMSNMNENNPAFSSFDANIKTHLAGVFGTESLVIEKLDESFFKKRENIDRNFSSVVELRCPAVVYSAGWLETFLEFLKKLYPSFVEAGSGQIKFVEDAASFPRELFTGTTLFNRFKKMVTTQTKWDPAGLSGYALRRFSCIN